MVFPAFLHHNLGGCAQETGGVPMFYIPEEDFGELDDFEDRLFVVADACQPDMPIVYASPEFFALTGYPQSEVIGHNCRFLQGPDTSADTRDALRTALGESRMITADILNYRKDGTSFWNRLRMKPILDDGGDLMYVFGIQNVIQATDVRPEPIFDKIVD